MISTEVQVNWKDAGSVKQFPVEGGLAVKIEDKQIAVFHFTRKQQWYACDNRCPHKGDMVIARGLTADRSGKPAVACPMHKKVFDLETGNCISEEGYRVDVYPVKIENDRVMIGLS